MIVAKSVRAYLDTLIVSALVKHDIPPEEDEALEKLFSLHTQRKVELFCSEVVKEEIDAIPAHLREPHSEKLAQFLSIPKVGVGGVTRMTLAGFGGQTRAFANLSAWSRFMVVRKMRKTDGTSSFASQNGIKYLVTVENPMLSKTDAILKATGV